MSGSLQTTVPVDVLGSICVDCAIDPNLKRFVQTYGDYGSRCSLCQQTDVIASRPESYEALASLMCTLIRFYFNEWEYNPHWGGERAPHLLLMKPNPIVRHEARPGLTCDLEEREDFLNGLFDQPWPDYDKGICIYHGFHEGMRLPPLTAIRNSDSPTLTHAIQRLREENYFEVEPELRDDLSELGNAINVDLKAGETFYRARIGHQERFIETLSAFDPEILFQPYLGRQIGAPPPPDAKAGRANREGVSFLYLSTDAITASAEVRPHPGHLVSIGVFRATQDLRFADFGAIDILDFASSDKRLDLFHLSHSIDHALGLPVTPEERSRYTVTQLIADILRHQGYHGIRFKSSVAEGANLCVFRPDLFTEVPGMAKVLRVAALRYSTEEVPCLLVPTDDHMSIDRT
jgi:hypothetical protein